MKKSKKVVQLIVLICLCMLPVLIISGCGDQPALSCTLCGSNSNRCLLYASGQTSSSVYRSCVGPAGCVGFGCNSVCWPTEWLCTESSYSEGVAQTKESSSVCYYDTFGCIGQKESKSVGTHSSTLCGGCGGCGESYKEEVGDQKQGYTSVSCFGITCSSQPASYREINNSLPRQYPMGCYTNCGAQRTDAE